MKGGDLRAYQVDGVRFLVSLINNRVNGILADDMVRPPIVVPSTVLLYVV